MPIEHHAGADVYVTRRGQGAPMVMLHCSLASHDMLLRLAKHFTADHAVTLMDHPGHGRSADWAGDPPVVDLAMRQALELIDAPAHVVGHSFGGLTALRMAQVAPDKISALTLIEPVFMSAAKGPAARAHEQDWLPFQRAFARGDRAGAAEQFINLWGLGIPWARLPAAQRQSFVDRIHIVAATTRDVMGDPHGIEPILPSFTIPVTLIEGTRTQPIISEIHDTLQALIPTARRVRIDGAGHMAPLTHPAEVAEAIRG